MTMITPPVPEADLPQEEAQALTLMQKLAASDKGAVIAGLVHVAVLLTASLGLKLTADQVAVLGSLVTAGLTYFLSLKINAKK